MNIARDCGKYIVCVSADQTERADDYDENHGKHHSVFGNILPLIAQPNVSQILQESASPNGTTISTMMADAGGRRLASEL